MTPTKRAANLQETSLSPKTDWNTFGKVGTFPVDGQVYAQPLYVSGVAIGGVSYNVLYVATMHNSVFAFQCRCSAIRHRRFGR